jgi:hypothetical protein
MRIPPALLEQVKARALDQFSLRITPDSPAPDIDALVLANGASKYGRPHSNLYTCTGILHSEDRLLSAAQRVVIPAATAESFDAALTQQSKTFDAGQLRMAKEFACSDRLLLVGVGPAGAGKTTALRLAADTGEMNLGTPPLPWRSPFQATREHRRFTEFADAVRTHTYIVLCWGPPGVGKTLSARHHAGADDWDQWQPPFPEHLDPVPERVLETRTAFFTPPRSRQPYGKSTKGCRGPANKFPSHWTTPTTASWTPSSTLSHAPAGAPNCSSLMRPTG